MTTFQKKQAALPSPGVPSIPQLFLENVAYGPLVQFLPVHQIDPIGTPEHFLTHPLFIEAAQTNTLQGWEERGIPPIYAFKDSRARYFHLMAEGQTRINSAKSLGKEVGIPVWDISDCIILVSESEHMPPHVIHQMNGYNPLAWNFNKNPLKPTTTMVMDEDAFCGFC